MTVKKSGTTETRRRKDWDHSALKRSVIPQAFWFGLVCLSLSTHAYKLVAVNIIVTLLWSSIPPPGGGEGEGQNTASSFYGKESGIMTDCMNHMVQHRLVLKEVFTNILVWQ